MGSASRASLIVATSMGAVEALKDQVGLCRWNYAIRSLDQHAKSNLGSFSQVARPSAAVAGQLARGCNASEGIERLRRREADKLEKVVHLVCWGPN